MGKMKFLRNVALSIVALFIGVGSARALDDIIYIDPVEIVRGNKRLKVRDGLLGFCLDRSKDTGDNTLTRKLTDVSSYYSADVLSNVKNVIAMSYRLGLGTKSQHKITVDGVTVNVTDDELYVITQFAVWTKAHGVNTKDGFLRDYQPVNFVNNGIEFKDDGKWLEENNRVAIYNYLINEDNYSKVLDYSIDIESNDNDMKLDSNGKYYVSGDYNISTNLDSVTEYSVTVNSNGMNACVLYGDKCETTAIVDADKTFKLRVDNANYEGEVTVTANVEVRDAKIINDELKVYMPDDVDTYQNVAVVVSSEKTQDFNDSVVAKVVKSNNDNPQCEVKKDENGNVVLDENGKPVCKEEKNEKCDFVYDEDGNIVYDENENPLCQENFNEKCEFVYDENGNVVVDTNGNPVCKEKNNEKCEFVYDEDGNIVLDKDGKPVCKDDDNDKCEIEYDENGNIVLDKDGKPVCKDDDNDKCEIEYDENGNIVLDENGNPVCKENNGDKCIPKRDENGNILKDENGNIICDDSMADDGQITDVPRTGLVATYYIFGIIVMLLGIKTIVFSKKRES